MSIQRDFLLGFAFVSSASLFGMDGGPEAGRVVDWKSGEWHEILHDCIDCLHENQTKIHTIDASINHQINKIEAINAEQHASRLARDKQIAEAFNIIVSGATILKK